MKNFFIGFVGLFLVLSVTAKTLLEGEKRIPLIQDVDVVVVGGTCGAVAAAESAAKAGASVMLVSPCWALGEEFAGTLRLWAHGNEVKTSALMLNMFGFTNGVAEIKTGRYYTTPLQAKKTLDSVLLDAGVPFLTGAYTTDILVDEKGEVAGVVIVNRSGRQAIKAKIVIDASPRALLARLAGADITPFPAGEYAVSRVVIGDAAPDCGGDVIRHKDWKPSPDVFKLSGKTKITPALFECNFKVKFAGGDARSIMDAEHVARDKTFTNLQLEAADRIFFIPPDHIKSKAPHSGGWPNGDKLNLDALSPANVPHLYVLGPMADISREAAPHIARPGGAIKVGMRLGERVAKEAKTRGALSGVCLRGKKGGAKIADIREIHGSLTAPYINASGEVKCLAHELPVLAEVDLVVAGGGTTGGPAAVAAVRNGVKTIVIDMLCELGGVQTAGMICGYYYGNQRGFTKTIDKEVKATGRYRSQAKGEWYRRSVLEGGGEVWFGCMVVGAYMQGNTLKGVVVAMPDGTRGVVLSKAVIDATGNADVAAAAGEPTEFYQDEELISQGVGQAVILLGEGGHNNDFSFIDDRDASDISFFGIRTRQMTEAGWDVSQIVNSRERRRIKGVYRLTVLDYLTARTFPDTIIQHKSRFDLHGWASHDFFKTKNIRKTNHVTMEANAPYRALLPKTTDGLLVAGLGISSDRDAMSILRMQPDLQNQGYAAAYAVYLALSNNTTLRSISVKELQKHLVSVGILPEKVMHEKDSYPISDSMLKMAAHDVMFGYSGLPYIFADPERAKPYLLEKYKELGTHSSGINPDISLIYAHVLAMLGDASGEDELVSWVKEHGWWDKWKDGLGNGHARMDSYLIALGRIKSKKAVPAIIARAQQLVVSKNDLSTKRARVLGLTCQSIGDPAFAGVLAGLLERPEVKGYSITLEPKIHPVPGYHSRSTYSQEEKSNTPREVNLAAALYRVGDKDGKGEAVLKKYAQDPRGFYANYARRVLSEKWN
ncbi:MAG: FAD-dependent oxidoreductase [Kiritimatiellae bacterium]|jgi:ribulose 1,5-bisphosphate synthetase/thiazole synthase|nr:FAD-dependent oxidoreductase [Kiritimatiellia bacterium]